MIDYVIEPVPHLVSHEGLASVSTQVLDQKNNEQESE